MHVRTTVRSIVRQDIIFLLFCVLCVPSLTQAATTKPSCTLTAQTSEGSVTLGHRDTVFLKKGDRIQIGWKSKNATEAVDRRGNSLALSGTASHSPKKTTTYTYRFNNESKRVTCSATVNVVTGSFATSSLRTASSKPTLSGTASGTKSVQIKIMKEGEEKIVYESRTLKVKNGIWKTKITKRLPHGTYDVVLVGKKNIALNTIAHGTLTVGASTKKVEQSESTLVVELVPLLLGGTTRANATIPVSYLQVINIGKEPTSIHGFTITQKGSASTEAILGMTVVDDSGVLKGSATGDSLFNNGSAFVPIDATFAPGQMRLFTIKAMLADNLTSYLGTQLKIVISDVDTKAAIKGKFPIYGTTWTLGNGP